MARGASGLLEAIARAQSCAGGTKPAVPTAKGRATATTPSCQQQLSSESCQQQPSYPANHSIESSESCQQQPYGQGVALCPIKGSEPCSPPTRSTICITCIGQSAGPFARSNSICA